jgi:transcriptional regulator with XRE-family HTH domain
MLEVIMNKKDALKKEVGFRLKKIREKLSFSQDRMASFIETGRTNYSKYENGEVFPNYLALQKMCANQDVSLDWLICEKGSMFFKDKEDILQQVEAHAEKPIKDEYLELFSKMEQIPLLYYEVMAYYQRFKLEHKELLESTHTPPS